MQDEAFQHDEARRAHRAEVAASEPMPGEAESSASDRERRIAELTRALAATRERESDFRQAAFDLNAELLRKDAEIDGLRERLEGAAAAEAATLQSRVSELEGLMQTRGFRAVVFWWRVKRAIRPR